MKKPSPFQRTSLQILRVKEMVKQDPSFKRVFTRNITESFFSDLSQRIHGDKPDHFILYLWGQTGTFKSSVAQSIATQFYKTFSEENIVFDNRSILDIMPSLGNKSIVIRDESPKEFGMGTMRINSEVATYTETLRKAQISLIFIRPIFMDFPQAHFYLRTIEYRTDFSQVRVGIQDPTSQKYLGFVFVDIEKDNAIWLAYETKKDAFLKSVLSSDNKGLDLEQHAEQVLKHEDFDPFLKKKEIRLIVYKLFKGMTTNEISMIESEVFLRMRKLQ